MAQRLRFGGERKVQFDLAAGALVADWTSAGAGLPDPAPATVAALHAPIELPPIAQALTPDDHIAIALDSDTPQAARIAAGAIQALLEGGAADRRIAVVLSRPRATDSIEAFLGETLSSVSVDVHDPDNSGALCYLAATEGGEPIYLNRRLVEADFVLPIGPARLTSSFGYLGGWGGLIPAFADRVTRQRFRVPSALKRAAARQLSEEAERAAWLLGVQFLVQVVPGPDGSVAEVLAGSGPAVLKQGEQRCELVWQRPIAKRASLVVAAISGGPEQQTWENFGRALYAASQAVAEDGAIALCTQLRDAPGPALQGLGELEDWTARQQALEQQASDDAQAASLLAELLESNRLYLLSELNDEMVEGMGLVYVEREDEIVRLSRAHRTCILLGDAQYAMPQEG